MDLAQCQQRPLSPNRPACSQAPPVKRRAAQACLSCRNRKVRCDATVGGMPCTNCRLDGVVCEVKESQRGRRPSSVRTGKAIDASVRFNRYGQEDYSQHATAGEDRRLLVTLDDGNKGDTADAEGESELYGGSVIYCQSWETPRTQQQPLPEEPKPTSDVEDELSEELEGNISRLQSPPPSPLLSLPGLSQQSSQQEPGPLEPQGFHAQHHPHFSNYHHLDHNPRCLPGTGEPLRLPSYIRPVPRHLDGQDLHYMISKRCLQIPDHELRDELIRVFISIVYPLVPIIDVEELIEAVVANDGRNPISLLVFQAIMFVAVAFVDIEYLLARGYSSHKSARMDFFNRVRILYSLNYERDRVALTQSLLAITYWYDAPDDDKDTWYWMGTALTTAQVAGFHRDPASAGISQQQQQQQQRVASLQRRIWWSCVTRDLLLALGLRRPPRIRDNDYNVSMLCEADFDLTLPSATMIHFFRSSKFPCPDQASKFELAITSIELARLCLTVGRILHTQYTSVGAYYGGSEYLGPFKPKRTSTEINTLAQCAAELCEWIQKQNARVLYVPGNEPPLPRETADWKEDVVRFHRIQLHMIYLAALGALRRPSVFCRDQITTNAGDRGSVCTDIALDPAIEMIKLAFDLQRNDQLRYLTTTAVPAFLSVSLVHLLGSRQGDEKDRNLSFGRLYQSVYVLQRLQSIYSSADYAVCFLKAILAKAGLRVPGSSLWMNDGANSKQCETSTNNVSMDMHPSEVAAACMYPSPSASLSVNNPMEGSPSPTTTLPTDVVQCQWELPLDRQLYGEVPPLHELVSGSDFFGSWTELDNVVPTDFDFESAFLSVSEKVSFMYSL